MEKRLAPVGAGTVKMMAEEPDDLWLVYNIISAGDTVLAETNRKVVLRDTSDACKSKSDARNVRLHLEVKVETSDYSGGDAPAVRLHGKNVLQNGYVGVGQYHTLELHLMRPFELTKARWDAAALAQVSEACVRRPQLRVHGKKQATADEEEEDEENKFATEEKKVAEKKKNKDKRKKQQREQEKEKTAEEKALEKFERLRRSQPDKVCYGVADVGLAAEWKAIGTLLVAERLLRSADAGTRRTYAGVADAVRESKGSVCVFRAAPGARDGGLEMYTGVAAVLRFPLPQI